VTFFNPSSESPLLTEIGIDAIAFSGVLGVPASITATGGTPQTATVTTAFASPFQGTVTDIGGNVVPGVTVTFAAPGSGPSGTFSGGAIVTAVTNASGVATSPAFTANATSGGPYNVIASLPVAGSSIPAEVSTTAAFSLKNVDYNVTPVTTSQTVTAGGTANYSLNFVAIIGNTTNSTTFTCQGLPALSSCLFTPATLPANSGNGPFTLAISTTSTHKTANIGIGNKINHPLLSFLRPGSLMLFAMLAMLLTLFFAQAQKIRRLRLSAVGLICALVLFAGCLVGCGSLGTGFPLISTQPGTPAGNYPITVDATSGTVQRTTIVTLVVQ
jgi:hypothetical protein